MKKQIPGLLLSGIFGSVIWLAADIVLGYLPGGIAKSGFMSDENILAQILEGAPLWRFTLSTALGTIGLMISVFGYIGIYKLFTKQAKILSKLTIFGGIGGSVAGAVYHNICTSSEWYYVKVGGADRFSILTEYMKQNEILMRINGALFCLFGICMFIAVITKRTVLPKWCAVFNLMLFYPILMVIGYPGYMSIGAIIMFSGLAIYSLKTKADESIQN